MKCVSNNKKAKKVNYAVIDTGIINRFLNENSIGLYEFYDMCQISVNEFRSLLAYHERIDNNIFYKIASIINVPVQKLFEGISKEAKDMLKKHQSPLPFKID